MRTFTLHGWPLPVLLLALSMPAMAQDVRNHDTGPVQLEVFDNGFIGSSYCCGPHPQVNGFFFNGSAGSLFEGQLIVANSETGVCGEAYAGASGQEPPNWVNTQPFTTLTPPFDPPYEEFDEGYRVAFDCSGDADPLPVEVIERSYSSTGDDFVVTEFEVMNTSSSALNGVHVGAFADFDVGDATLNLCDFDAGTQLLYCWDPTGTNPNYYGMTLLGDDVSGWEFDVGAGANPTDANLWAALTNGGDTPPVTGADRRTVLGTGPYSIPAGGSATARLAFVAGTSQADIIANAAAAQASVGSCDLSFNAADLSYDAATRKLTVAVTVHNGGTSPHGARLELDYNRNGGPPQGTKTLGAGTLPAGATASRTLSVSVPGAAPDGNYNLTLRLVDTGTGADCDTYAETVAISAPRLGAGSGGAFEVDRVVDLTPEASAMAGGSAVSPNPFARQTEISYEVAATADVRLAVYDVLGREVAVLVDGRQEAGAHTAAFDARGLAAGTYVYRLVVGNDVQTGRMTLAY